MIQEGDVLISINGQIVTGFVPLEEFMDSHVHGSLDLVLERGGDKIKVTIPVQDLHSM